MPDEEDPGVSPYQDQTFTVYSSPGGPAIGRPPPGGGGRSRPAPVDLRSPGSPPPGPGPRSHSVRGRPAPTVPVGALCVSPMPLIAVVDDDISVRRSLRRLLQSAGYAVVTFASADQYLETSPPQVACLILDIHLGGLSGFQLHERLQAGSAAVPIIFITAYDDEPTRTRIDRAGVAGHLYKPFEDEALLDAIRRATGEPGPPGR